MITCDDGDWLVYVSQCRHKGMLLAQFAVALQVIEENASFCES